MKGYKYISNYKHLTELMENMLLKEIFNIAILCISSHFPKQMLFSCRPADHSYEFNSSNVQCLKSTSITIK